MNDKHRDPGDPIEDLVRQYLEHQAETERCDSLTERVLESNAVFLEKKAKEYKSRKLKKLSKDNRRDRANLSGPQWNKQRKTMRKRQHSMDMQQAW